MIYVLSFLTTVLTIVFLFVVNRFKRLRQIIAKILVNLALVVGIIAVYLTWFFIFKCIL